VVAAENMKSAFEMSMNRAAERAAPEAKDIFWDAVKQMNFSDARKRGNSGHPFKSLKSRHCERSKGIK